MLALRFNWKNASWTIRTKANSSLTKIRVSLSKVIDKSGIGAASKTDSFHTKLLEYRRNHPVKRIRPRNMWSTSHHAQSSIKSNMTNPWSNSKRLKSKRIRVDRRTKAKSKTSLQFCPRMKRQSSIKQDNLTMFASSKTTNQFKARKEKSPTSPIDLKLILAKITGPCRNRFQPQFYRKCSKINLQLHPKFSHLCLQRSQKLSNQRLLLQQRPSHLLHRPPWNQSRLLPHLVTSLDFLPQTRCPKSKISRKQPKLHRKMLRWPIKKQKWWNSPTINHLRIEVRGRYRHLRNSHLKRATL